MTPNPTLMALGLSPKDRAVLIHTDDIGMCHASLAAYADLAASGTISAGSVMVPCPWFPATAQFCRSHPEIADMGVHVTLTSEWDSGYRWGPVSTCDPASGLLDEAGYMHQTTQAAQAHGRPDAVHREIESQVQHALDRGIDVTHLDTHMGTAFSAGFVQAYIQVALQHQVPPFLVRNIDRAMAARHTDADIGEIDALLSMLRDLETQGLPMFDAVTGVPFDRRETHLDDVKRVLADLQPGLTYLITHPSKDTPELRAIMPEGWAARVADYEVLMSEQLRDVIDDQGIHIVTWRTLRELMRAQMSG